MDSVDNKNNETRSDTLPESFGCALAQARQDQGLSLAEMASRLRQTESRVRLMESGDWEQLGPPVYGRGYVAAYARALSLDGSTTVAYFDQLEARRLEREKQFTAARPRRSRLSNYHVLFACVAATALVAVPVATWLMHAFQRGTVEVAERELKEPSGNLAEDGDEPLLASMASLPEIGRPPRSKAPTLVLRFSESTWIEARDSHGAQLAYGLMAADSEQRLPAAAGLAVRLGNANGVSAELDGEPYDLSAFTREDLVEFTIPAADRQ